MNISPDDPRLTEYALGEMPADAAAAFEASMANHPATFDEIHEIRSTAATLGKSLALLPTPTLTDAQRHRILRLADAPRPQSLPHHPDIATRPTAFWTWFGKFATTAAAASIAIACLIFAYQRGYQNATVSSNPTADPAPGSLSKADPLPGETPSIRITVLDPGGEAQPAASRPLNQHAVLPVGPGNQDALLAAFPQVHLPPIPPTAPDSATGQPHTPNPPAEGILPIASAHHEAPPAGAPSIMENPFVEVSSSPRSSFPLRAAATSFAAAAGSIRGTGRLPAPASIAVEEFINAFSYQVPKPTPSKTPPPSHPFAAGAEVFSCPWEPAHRLVRITLATPHSSNPDSAEPEIVAENIELLVEFNRSHAARYRLVGFDGAGLLSAVGGSSPHARTLRAGDSVTALYEVIPIGGPAQYDDLRYSPLNFATSPLQHSHELLCLSISYSSPNSPTSPPHSLVVPVIDPGLSWNRSPGDFQFAAAAAAFGMSLSGSKHLGDFSFDQILALAERALRGETSPDPRRTDFLELVRSASKIARPQ